MYVDTVSQAGIGTGIAAPNIMWDSPQELYQNRSILSNAAAACGLEQWQLSTGDYARGNNKTGLQWLEFFLPLPGEVAKEAKNESWLQRGTIRLVIQVLAFSYE